MARRDDVDPGLPIKLNPCSNGEFVPGPPGPVAAEAMRRARAEADDRARRLGMTRRRFLLSSMGAAAGLLVLDACSKESGKATGQPPAGSFSLPPEASADPGAARTTVGGTETIFDVQTHLLDYELVPEGPNIWSGFPYKNCGEADQRDCFGVDHWMEELFVRSDTAMVVLSAVPIVGDADPLSIDVMERARRVATRLCGDGRVLLQGHAVPNVGRIEAALDGMRSLDASHPIAAWKVYTHAPGPGWSFVDATGQAFLTTVEEIAGNGGTHIVAVHKGISGGDPAASPVDIGPAAVAHPDLRFVVYHSGYEPGNTEGVFAEDGKGVDRLVRSLRDAGVHPGGNVYAELGSTWRAVMGDPDQAAHVLGKLLSAVGEDNILWGTDSIWYGSPQDQIQAFRTFELTARAQERFGYPALTASAKQKIFGGNAARLYGIDLTKVADAKCQFSADDVEHARQQTALGNATYGPVTATAVAATFRRDHPWTVT
jgi:hypothetical protein